MLKHTPPPAAGRAVRASLQRPCELAFASDAGDEQRSFALPPTRGFRRLPAKDNSATSPLRLATLAFILGAVACNDIAIAQRPIFLRAADATAFDIAAAQLCAVDASAHGSEQSSGRSAMQGVGSSRPDSAVPAKADGASVQRCLPIHIR